MAGSHEVAARVFRMRKMSGRARLEALDALAEVGDAQDVVAGLAAEMNHLAREADALGERDTFDRERRDELNARRRDIRRELTDAQDKAFDARLKLLIVQTQDAPDMEWCRENLAPEDIDAIYEAWEDDSDDPPTGKATDPTGSESS